jgi:hypothetical protein
LPPAELMATAGPLHTTSMRIHFVANPGLALEYTAGQRRGG